MRRVPAAVPVAALATGALAALDWWAVGRARRDLERWAKPAVVVGLLAVALAAGGAGSTAGRWVLLALALGLVGDVLLLDDGDTRFVGGLAAFLVGHLAWVAAVVTAGLDEPRLAAVGAVVVLVALVAGRRILPAAVRSSGPALGGAVAAYMAVIGVMAVLGWASGDLLVGLGATLFVASDTVLALGRFVEERPWTRLTVMVTYHLAQSLLVAGLLLG